MIEEKRPGYFQITIKGDDQGLSEHSIQGNAKNAIMGAAAALCAVLDAAEADWSTVCYVTDQIKEALHKHKVNDKKRLKS